MSSKSNTLGPFDNLVDSLVVEKVACSQNVQFSIESEALYLMSNCEGDLLTTTINAV